MHARLELASTSISAGWKGSYNVLGSWKWLKFINELNHRPIFLIRILVVLDQSQKGSEKRILILFIECLLCPSHLKYPISFNAHYNPMKSVLITLKCHI